MAIETAVETSTDIPSYPVWRMSVAQYHAMIEAGILSDDDPVELLEGWLSLKMPKNPRHTLVTQLAHDVLGRMVPAGWFINVQEPLTTMDSEPEPDVAVVRGARRDYRDRHPQPDEVGLVVEVADATLQRDRTLKLRLYARARIPIYWILNLQESILEIYSEPIGGGLQASYRQRQDYGSADEAPLILDGQEVARVAVKDIIS